MQKIIIGRPILGITLNGLEYCENDERETLTFDDEEQAKYFLTVHGFSDDVIENHFIYENVEVVDGIIQPKEG